MASLLPPLLQKVVKATSLFIFMKSEYLYYLIPLSRHPPWTIGRRVEWNGMEGVRSPWMVSWKFY